MEKVHKRYVLSSRTACRRRITSMRGTGGVGFEAAYTSLDWNKVTCKKCLKERR